MPRLSASSKESLRSRRPPKISSTRVANPASPLTEISIEHCQHKLRVRARETRPRVSTDRETRSRQMQGVFVRPVQQGSSSSLRPGRPGEGKPTMSSAAAHKQAPPMKRLLERLEQKCCPQGLHVILEELRWMGDRSMTYEQLSDAVLTDLRAPHPRIRRVAEGVYWFAELDIPLGWSLFRDKRMLPCFYRKYPPAISWEDLDLPENVLPPPPQPPRQA